MTLFLAFLICGLGEVWALLFMWGFSAGASNAVPFVTLVGCLAVLFLATPLALFLPRLASAIAVLGAAAIFTWPVAIAAQESIVSAIPFAVPPTAVTGVAITRLWRTRREGWFVVASKPGLWWRVALVGVPIVLFAMLFNVRAVVALLLDGPP